MQIKNAIQRFLAVMAFSVCLSIGYFAVSITTSCTANATVCCEGTSCTSASAGAGTAIYAIFNEVISPALSAAQAQLTAYMALALQGFTSAVIEKIFEVTLNIIGWFDTFWYHALLPTLQTMTDQLSVMATDQARALGAFRDAANFNRLVADFKEHAIEAHRQFRPNENGCVAAAVMGGTSRAATFRRAYNAAAPAEKLPRSSNSADTPAGGGVFADMKERWDTYKTRYCKKGYNNDAAGCTADQPFANRDIDVIGEVFLKDTIDLKDADTKKSVDDLINNVAEPFVKDLVPAGAVESAPGQAALLEGDSYRARRQVIYDSLYHPVSRRIPGSQMKDFLQPLRAASGLPPAVLSDDPSYNEVMQAMMTERFRSGQYGLGQVDGAENNGRERVVQEALQVIQMSDQLDLMDRYALVLAAQVGEEVRAAKPSGTAASGAPLKP